MSLRGFNSKPLGWHFFMAISSRFKVELGVNGDTELIRIESRIALFA